ncbi:hypothetical protein ABKU85_004147 [Salmonella enterica]|nr:hypothetical protein [Salmonella enterica]EJS5648194.1 hypothetical protein [Salmonella enterica]ELG8872768.1 hypothetical protein [Salmonella enterica subsp. enterica serovar Saintpaul]
MKIDYLSNRLWNRMFFLSAFLFMAVLPGRTQAAICSPTLGTQMSFGHQPRQREGIMAGHIDMSVAKR